MRTRSTASRSRSCSPPTRTTRPSAGPNLEIVGRRLLPPTRLLRSGALTVDPILLRGASLGAGWRAERGGAAGTVYHAAAGALPIASGIPIVAAVLDLAPWAMPAAYQRGVAARFGQRIRARLLQGRGGGARAGSRDRDRGAAAAPREAGAPPGRAPRGARRVPGRGVRIGRRGGARGWASGPRYAVYAGRYDARQDLPTLLDALAILSREPHHPGCRTPAAVPVSRPRPPGRRGSVSSGQRPTTARRCRARRAARASPTRWPTRRGCRRTASRRSWPAHGSSSSRCARRPAASRRSRRSRPGCRSWRARSASLPEVVGAAGILVEPGDAVRLATALRAAWSDDDLHAQLVAAARRARPAMPGRGRTSRARRGRCGRRSLAPRRCSRSRAASRLLQQASRGPRSRPWRATAAGEAAPCRP